MERVLKRGSIVFVVALAALLLVTNLEATHASDEANEQNRQLLSSDNQFVSFHSQTVANDNQAVLSSTEYADLPDFIIKLCEYQSQGNASELARLKREWAQQKKLNRAIDNENPPQSPAGSLQTMDSYGVGYMSNLNDYSPPTIYGHVDNPYGIEGDGPDNDATYYEATGWTSWEDPPGIWHYFAGEALTNGDASTPYIGLAEFHVTARIGHESRENPPWHNYLIVEVSDTNTWGSWHPVNWIEVHSNYFVDYTIGNININFKYISVYSTCPLNWPVEKSSFEVDCVQYIMYYRPVTLTVSSGEGGSTDPSGPIVVWQYQQPKVTAYANPYYAFDYWVIDGTSYDPTNPIWIYMDTDHTMQAVFHQITDAWLTVYTLDQVGNPLDANIYIDNNGRELAAQAYTCQWERITLMLMAMYGMSTGKHTYFQ